MNTCIGATGTQGTDGFICEAAQGSFQPVLNRFAARLTLPTLIGLPVVANA
jgi:hypothetical protein